MKFGSAFKRDPRPDPIYNQKNQAKAARER
jgi:hypothetical protein